MRFCVSDCSWYQLVNIIKLWIIKQFLHSTPESVHSGPFRKIDSGQIKNFEIMENFIYIFFWWFRCFEINWDVFWPFLCIEIFLDNVGRFVKFLGPFKDVVWRFVMFIKTYWDVLRRFGNFGTFSFYCFMDVLRCLQRFLNVFWLFWDVFGTYRYIFEGFGML